MQPTASRSKIMMSADGTGIVSQTGGLLLTPTLWVTGLDHGLDTALERWRPARAVHSPGKIITDLAVAVALGGDCVADVAVVRAQPELAGLVASDPGDLPAGHPPGRRRAQAAEGHPGGAGRRREWAWDLAGGAAPSADGGLVTVDIDATIVTACSEKEQAARRGRKPTATTR